MKIRRFILIWGFAQVAFTTPVLTGVLRDTTFARSDSIEVEVLENGERAQALFGESFQIPLTEDQNWNLCVRDGLTEQCYLIEREGKDSLIKAELLNDNQLEVFSSFLSDEEKRTLAEVAALEEDQDVLEKQFPEEQREFDQQTRLRKLVVTVKKRPKRSLGQSTVSAKNIKRMPGLAEADVVKAIQALPGVVASSDFSSKIYVRGGGADQNLFLFDNGVVYSPVHFFGLFSTFLVEGVDRVEFYKGGFSPEFGNRLSSVVDIHSRPGGDEGDTLFWKGSGLISTFASTLNLEGSKAQTRLNFSARATYLKEVLWAMRKAGLTDIDFDYRFYDLQGSWYQKINDKHKFSVSYYGGMDKLIFTPISVDWGNTVLPVNYFFDYSEDWRFSASYAYSLFDQHFEFENIQSFENIISSHTVKTLGEYRGKENQIWRMGLEEQYLFTRFRNNSIIAGVDNVDDITFFLSSPFVEQVLDYNDFQFKSGLRIDHISSLNKVYFEPRFSARYQLNKTDKIDFHVGQYYQFVNSILFGDFETINEFYFPSKKGTYQEIPPTSSLLFSLGYSTEINKNWEWITEGYYKTLNNLIVFAPDEKPDSIRTDPNSTLGDLLFRGEGYSLGAEVSLRRKEGVVTGGVSYSYSYSILKESGLVVPAKWDMPHAFKLDMSINWRDPKENAWLIRPNKPYFRSSIAVKYSSGLPYSEVTGYKPSHLIDQNEGNVESGGPNPIYPGNISTPQGGRNASRYPDYFRFDVKVVDWGVENDWNFSWTILNATNHENVFSYAYDNSDNPPSRQSITQFPFFPMLLSYQFYF